MLLFALACIDYSYQAETPHAEAPLDAPAEELYGAIEVNPGLLDFGGLAVGATVDEVVTVANVGEGTLWLGDTYLDAPGAFSATTLGADTLAPGETTELVVSFAPEQASVRGNALFLESDDPERPVVEVPLLGSGLVPEVFVDPLSHDFGELRLGEVESLDIQIVNLGAADLVIEEATYETTSSELVADLTGLPSSLAPAEAAHVTVYYAPTDALPDEGALVLTTNDPDLPSVSSTQTGTAVGCEVGTDGTPVCTYTLYNSEDRSSGLCVDDIVMVYLDGTLIFESPDDKAGCESPVTFTASPGQELTFEGYDYWGNCRGIEEIWLHNEEVDVMSKLSNGRQDGCNGYASGMTLFFWAREPIPSF